MARWSGAELDEKKAQALSQFRQAMASMTEHDDWLHLTEIVWQNLNDAVAEAQLAVLRQERFNRPPSTEKTNAGLSRVERFEKYRRMMRALNYLFKCVDIDWAVFLQTVVDLVEGNDGGLGRTTQRDQPDGASSASCERVDSSGTGE